MLFRSRATGSVSTFPMKRTFVLEMSMPDVPSKTCTKWEILATVRNTQQLRVPREHLAEAWMLQALGYVLCYRNGEIDWFDAHPLLDPLLTRSD